MTAEEVRKHIGKELNKAGSLRKLGDQVGVSHSFLADIIAKNRGISASVAAKFGFERIEKKTVTFRRIK